ncbi:MAG: hypothetical protein ACYSTY_04300 [Planctomycetota bacterium]|jgi:hypothetical protein
MGPDARIGPQVSIGLSAVPGDQVTIHVEIGANARLDAWSSSQKQ